MFDGPTSLRPSCRARSTWHIERDNFNARKLFRHRLPNFHCALNTVKQYKSRPLSTDRRFNFPKSRQHDKIVHYRTPLWPRERNNHSQTVILG